MADYPMTVNDGFFGDGGMWIFGLLVLLLLGGGGNGLFGGNRNAIGYENLATSNEIQRGFDNQNLSAQTRDILTAVNSGTAQNVSAVDSAKYDNINVMKDVQNQLQLQLANLGTMEQALGDKLAECCCNINRNIDSVNYNNAINTSNINANTTEQTQKILDAINANRTADLQNRINQLEMQNIITQNAININSATCGIVRYPMASTYSAGMNPFCASGCGCSSSSF